MSADKCNIGLGYQSTPASQETQNIADELEAQKCKAEKSRKYLYLSPILLLYTTHYTGNWNTWKKRHCRSYI